MSQAAGRPFRACAGRPTPSNSGRSGGLDDESDEEPEDVNEELEDSEWIGERAAVANIVRLGGGWWWLVLAGGDWWWLVVVGWWLAVRLENEVSGCGGKSGGS